MKWQILIEQEDIVGNFVAVLIDPSKPGKDGWKVIGSHDLRLLMDELRDAICYSVISARMKEQFIISTPSPATTASKSAPAPGSE